MMLGFLGFGELAFNISKILIDLDVEVLTFTHGRSLKTKERANNLKVRQIDSVYDFKNCDYLFSTVHPSSAKNCAIDSLKYFNGIFIDLNNISSKTAIEINDIFISNNNYNYVDAAVLGSIKNDNYRIIASTKKIDEINNLNSYGLDIELIGNKVGDASDIKMLRSFYTKGVSAILIETFLKAEELSLSNELFKYISLTEGKNFSKSSKSRIVNTTLNADRKAQEILEIKDIFTNSKIINEFYDFFKELDYKMNDFNLNPKEKITEKEEYKIILEYLINKK